MSIENPDHVYTGPVNFIVTQRADGEVDNKAAYVFDRVQLTERFEINAGLRYENNEALSTLANIAVPYPAPPAEPVVTQAPLAENTDDLGSYRVGFVFKPSESSSIYLAHGNSETPSQSIGQRHVRHRDELQRRSRGSGDRRDRRQVGAQRRADVDGRGVPQRAQQLPRAVGRSDDSRAAARRQLARRRRRARRGRRDRHEVVDIRELHLPRQRGLAVDSDQLLLGGSIDILAGDPLPNTPEHSASLWATFEMSEAFTIGYGVTYQGEYTFARASATAELYYTPDYLVHRAMATYAFNDNLALQVNLDNVTDEVYYERIRNNATNGWATPGAERSARGEPDLEAVVFGGAPARAGPGLRNARRAMLIQIPEVLTAAQVAEIRQLIDRADWVDGNVTSGPQAALAKRNRQLPEDSAAAKRAGEIVLDALGRNPLFMAAALPAKVWPPLFNRYGGGEEFGMHVDNAVRLKRGGVERLRSDLSATLFLCDARQLRGRRAHRRGHVRRPRREARGRRPDPLSRVELASRDARDLGRARRVVLLDPEHDPQRRAAARAVRHGRCRAAARRASSARRTRRSWR